MDLDQVKSYNEDVAAQRAKRDADYEEYEKAGRIWGAGSKRTDYEDYISTSKERNY